jgi:hypothetical protein
MFAPQCQKAACPSRRVRCGLLGHRRVGKPNDSRSLLCRRSAHMLQLASSGFACSHARQAAMKGHGPRRDVRIPNAHHGNVSKARLFFAVICGKLLISIEVHTESEECGLTSCEQLLVGVNMFR